MPNFDATQCKTKLKLAMSRIKLQKNKKDNLAKNGKREVADLLKSGKEGDARVKVENVIKDDFSIETLELMELFCELLMSRLSSIQSSKECPADLKEAICTIIYAAPRLDIEELTDIRKQFIIKFGKPFAQDAMSNKDNCVNARVVHKLGILTPENYLVYQYLTDIAKSFSIDWKAPQHETISQPTSNLSQSSAPGNLSFPSPPTHTGSSSSFSTPPSSVPIVPEVPVPSFNMNDLPGGGGGLNFPSTPSFSSSSSNKDNSLNFPSPPSNKDNSLNFPSPPSNKDNSLNFPSPPSGKDNSSSLNFPSPPSNKDNSLNFPSPPSSSNDSKSGLPDFDELSARFERLKKRDE